MDSSPILLFVYGTLMRGHRRHDLMQRGQFVAEATTSPGHLLVDCGGYPGLVVAPDHPGRVHGELHAVSPDHLALLDAYEDLPSGEYIRATLPVLDPNGGAWTAQAYVYHRPWESLPVVDGRWSSHHEESAPSRVTGHP